MKRVAASALIAALVLGAVACDDTGDAVVAGSGGAPASSGASAVGGGGAPASSGASAMGGELSACRLSVGDCRSPVQVECEQQNELCSGKSDYFNVLLGNEAVVTHLATSRDGRVVAAGHYGGGALSSVSHLGGEPEPLLSEPFGVQLFVASFDASGAAEWAFSDGSGTDVTGVAFAPNGDLLMQGNLYYFYYVREYDEIPVTVSEGFVVRLDSAGRLLWRHRLVSADDGVYPGGVMVDDDGRATFVGGFVGSLPFGTKTLDPEPRGLHSYVLQLDADGQALKFDSFSDEKFKAHSTSFVVKDDDGNVITAGNPGYTFVQKTAPDGSVLFRRLVVATDGRDIVGLTVDHELSITFGGTFRGELAIDNDQIRATGSPGVLHSWAAQLDASGRVRWLQAYNDPDDQILDLSSLTSDAHGNILLSGTLYGETREQIYVRKLRSNGDSLWRRTFSTKWPSGAGLAVDRDGAIWVGGRFHEHFAWNGELQAYDEGPHSLVLKLSP